MERKVKNLKNEEWRDIVGYEGVYKVSSCGRVKRVFQDMHERLVKPRDVNNRVTLCIKKTPVEHRVCKLVADAFIPNPNNYTIIRHLDGDIGNDMLENLEWSDTSVLRRREKRDFDIHDAETEKWRDVVGYEGLYMVSNYGRVMSVPHVTNGRHWKGRVRQIQYAVNLTHPQVHLSKNGTLYPNTLKVVVARSWLGFDGNPRLIRHLNGNPADCSVANLQIISK